MARTRRNPDGMFITGGAQTQDGSLPAYICNTCNAEVVWATSTRTGRKYLVSVYRGYQGQRFYVKRQPHTCPKENQ
jgi:hypothetical protein